MGVGGWGWGWMSSFCLILIRIVCAMCQELENANDELATKLGAYERNILQLIDTQVRMDGRRTAVHSGRRGG